MLLAIDMGNTNIVIGCLDGDEICFIERVSTDIRKTDLEYAVLLHTVLELHDTDPSEIKGAIISSVVPPLTNIVRAAIIKVTGHTPLIVGPGVKNGLNIRIDDPSRLGADLVVAGVAALNLYGSPVIVIDMGTATTVTVIDDKGVYIGGVILPGVGVSLESLTSETSQLPRISLEAPDKVIGKNTVDCMKSGVIFGQAAQIDGLIERFEDELGYKCAHVATGGLAPTIIPFCKQEITLNTHLLLQGLKNIYDKNQN